jgi:hypothetical protein
LNYCFYLLGGELSIERRERKRRKRKRIETRRERKGKGERRVELCIEALPRREQPPQCSVVSHSKLLQNATTDKPAYYGTRGGYLGTYVRMV